MILLIGSQKGGCGKSTLSVNIAAELTRQGRDVCLVDADRQGTASRWAQDRSDTELPNVHCVALYGRINAQLADLKQRYEFVIVDAAGRDSTELRTGLLAADTLLTPFRPSQPDLDTLSHLAEVVGAAKDLNESLICRAVLTLAPSNPMVNESSEAKEYLSEYPEFSLCKSIIKDRKAYRDTMGEGHGVVDWKDSKAKAEIQLLVQELF
jgi:chromosome partitioning protein